jgi:hypothetical protein
MQPRRCGRWEASLHAARAAGREWEQCGAQGRGGRKKLKRGRKKKKKAEKKKKNSHGAPVGGLRLREGWKVRRPENKLPAAPTASFNAALARQTFQAHASIVPVPYGPVFNFFPAPRTAPPLSAPHSVFSGPPKNVFAAAQKSPQIDWGNHSYTKR